MTIEAKIRISANAVQALQALAEIAGGMKQVSQAGAKASAALDPTPLAKAVETVQAKVKESTKSTTEAAAAANKRLLASVTSDTAQAAQTISQAMQKSRESAQAAVQQWREASARIVADLDKVRSAGTSAGQGLASINLSRTLGDSSEQAQGLGRQLEGVVGLTVRLAAGLAGLASAKGLADLSDTWSGMTARMRTATKDQETYNKALSASAQLAGDYQRSLEATARAMTKTYSAIQPLGGDIAQASAVTEAVLASLKIDGATAEESASALLQFSQALGKGVLNGEEFNAVAEAAPALLRALAEGLKVPQAQLKEMGAQGRLTTSMIVEGLIASLPELRRTAEQIPATISSSVQQVKDATLVYVGESDNAKAATQVLVQVMQGLSQNIGPVITVVGTLATVVGVTYVARAGAAAIASAGLAAQQLVLAAAARSAAAEMGITAVASRTLVGAIAGPAGLVLALGALAAGWMAVGEARREATPKDDLVKERADVESQMRLLRERLRAGKVNPLDAQTDLNAYKRQLADIDKLLAKRDQETTDNLKSSLKTKIDLQKEYEQERALLEADAQRRIAALTGKGSDAARASIQAELKERLELLEKRKATDVSAPGKLPTLADPAAVAAIEKEFKTRETIEKEYANKRADYIKAKDKEIELARSKGALDQVQQLESQKGQVLVQIEKARARTIEGLDKDSRVTRLAQARDMFDAEAALHQDALQRATTANEQAYTQGMIDFRAYLAERARLEDAAIQAQVNVLRQQQAAQQAAIAQNQLLTASAASANERVAAEDAIVRARQQVQRLEVDIAKLQRDQADNSRRRSLDESAILDTLRKQREQLDQQLRQATGTETAESIGRRVRAQYEEQLKALMASDQDPEPLFKLIDVEVERAKFQLLQRAFQETRDTIQQQEQQIEAERNAGLITEADAERRILDLRKQSLDTLRSQVKAMEDQSAVLDKAAGKPQAKEAGDTTQAKVSVTGLGDLRDSFEKTAKSSAVSNFSNLITDLATRAKSTGEALRDMVSGFGKAMLELLAKRMGEQLMDQLFDAAKGLTQSLGSMGGAGAGGAGGGGGGFWAAAATYVASLFHTGGIGGEGTGVTRSLPASTWSFAPRYHTGYTPPGLLPGEVAAIIKTDEEVLTADNPRHIKNAGKSMGSVSIKTGDVNVSGGQGSDSDMRSAGEDLQRTINAAIDQWAVRQMQPGGLLSGRG